MSNLVAYDIQGDYGYGHGYETVDCVTGPDWQAAKSFANEAVAVYRENEPGIPFRVRRSTT